MGIAEYRPQALRANRFANRLFGVEELVNVSLRDIDRFCEIRHGRLRVAVATEMFARGADDLVALRMIRRAALPGFVEGYVHIRTIQGVDSIDNE